MKNTLAVIALLLAFAAGAAVVYWWLTPEPVVRTEVVYRDRDILRRDTITVDRPVTRIVYRTFRDTVRVEVPVPTDFRFRGLVGPGPVRITRDSFTLTYWNPDSLRFEQDVYAALKPAFGWTISAVNGVDIGRHTPFLGIEARIRYRKVSLSLRPEVAADHLFAFRVALRYRLAGSDP